MQFSSIIFLFAFLPVFLLLYKLIPFVVAKGSVPGATLAKGSVPQANEIKDNNAVTITQNIVLVIGSLILYAYGVKWQVLILVASICLNYFFGRLLEKWSEGPSPEPEDRSEGPSPKPMVKTLIFVVAVGLNLSPLIFYKYFGGTGVPVGLSFFTFQSISYISDVYGKKIKAEKKFLNLSVYICMFFTLLSGPITRFGTVSEKIRKRNVDADQFENGVVRFMAGCIKKVLLADSLSMVATRIISHMRGGVETSALTAWLGAIAFTLEIYYDFSGYSDMAIGLGRMCGFELLENFNYPYISTSVREFWKRWHISLSSWFKDYVYIPLGGSRKGAVRSIFNLLVVWILTGIWHGKGWNFIAWGLMYFFVLTLERITGYGTKWKLPKVLGNIYTMLVVTIGWVLFGADNLREAYRQLRFMLGLNGNGFVDAATIHFVLNNIVLFVASLVFCFPIGKKLWKKKTLCECALAVLFLVSIVYLVKGGYSPFLYFNF